MRHSVLLTTVLLTLVAACGSGGGGSTTTGYMDVTPAEAKQLIEDNPTLVIIDVSPYWADGHIPGALSYPVGDGSLDTAIPMLDKMGMYLVYCHGDGPSIAGAQKLVDAGFENVYRLEGNYGAWVDAGYDVEKEMLTPEYMDVTPAEAKKLIEDNPSLVIIDVSPLWAQGHIPGAVNYPVGDGSLDTAIPMLDKMDMYLVYCHSDAPSMQGAQDLVDAGFENVYRLEGNFDAWVAAGYDVEKETVTPEYMDVSPAEAKKLIEDNPSLVIIDVSPLWAQGHIPGAVNYPVGDGSLDTAIPMLDKMGMYLVYCHGDGPSMEGAQKLINAGFENVYRLEGNYGAWVAAGYDVETPMTETLYLDFEGLPDLGADFVYEGWIMVDGSPVSTGRFSVDGMGALAPDSFDLDADQADTATMFILTIEPATGDDPAPSDTHVVAGPFDQGNADLDIQSPAALDTDFASASGSFILATPSTSMDDGDNGNGIWFLDPTGASPATSLQLPALPAGWAYEGWVVDTSGASPMPISTGTFTALDMADSDGAGPDAGLDAAPPFPGQDFIDPARDLTMDHMAVISVEPVPDNSPMPFQIKPLAKVIGMDTAPTMQMLDLAIGDNNITGTASFDPPMLSYTDVSPAEAKKLIEDNPSLVIIDVSPYWDAGHLPGALSYPVGDGSLDTAIPMLDKMGMYLVYCHGDGPSMEGAQKLINAGFENVYRLEGNYGAWVAAGYDVEKEMTTYMDVSPAEAKKLIEDNPSLVIIDVSPYWDAGHLPGALSYPVGDGSLDAAIPMLDKMGMYLVYCHGDGPSMLGAQKLIDAGFGNVYRLEGNYGAWVAAGYDVETN